MLKVGITGGIGSGKTTVCKIFESLGIPVYYADDRAKLLMVENTEIVEGVKSLFGADAYFPDGSLNRKKIAAAAFQNKDLLAKLNKIVHPAVFQDSITWLNAHAEAPYTLKEAAILFESGSFRLMDKNITVFAPEWDRIGRVMKRDGTAFDEVLSRISKQMPDHEKIKLADFLIYNDGSKSLIKQVINLHQIFTEV